VEPSPRFSVIKALAQELGLEKLAQLEVEAVRSRPIPLRLITALIRGDGRVRGSKTGSRLTPREREVMVLVSSGYLNREIAEQLDISPETVKHHLRLIYPKLGVHNRVQAVNAFIEEEA
jgi:DNA-binding CsgD family transcriptional regulator